MVYDCFSFFNELDLLEIRLNILDPYVDYFVLGESLETFSGLEKPLFYQEQRGRFAKWNHKIIHVVNDKLSTDNPFVRAAYQKDNLRLKLYEHAHDDDVIYFGDLDEIWKPQEIDDRVFNLKQCNYSYYLNYLSSEEWVGTIVGRWSVIRENTFNHWRETHSHVLEDGGWHFTNMGGAAQIIQKIQAYDHAHEVIPRLSQFKDYGIQERIDKGYDYLGRAVDYWGKPYVFTVSEEHWPQYLIDHKQEWTHLLKS